MKKCISIDEAVETKEQHKNPCSDCPFARTALSGWLGGMSKEKWVHIAHGDTWVDCHALKGHQCAGIAIYRANVCKRPRSSEVLILPKDKEKVFATPDEFLNHHAKGPQSDPL